MRNRIVSRRRLLQAGIATASFGVLAGGGTFTLGSSVRPAVHRLGFLGQTVPLPMYVGLNEGLRELGYIDGQNLTIEYRYAEGRFDRLPELAAELARLDLDLIVVAGNLGALAVKSATTVIPIVVALSSDIVAAGIITSLSQPGGNITGLTQISDVLVSKRVELLKETLPGLTRLAVLKNAANPTQGRQWAAAEEAARSVGLTLRLLEVREGSELAGAFEVATREGAEAIFTLDDALFPAHRALMYQLAAGHRLPLSYSGAEEARHGALIGYGPNIPNQFKRAATYVDKILKGAKPATLPIELPTQFDFVVNLKTAQALGVTIPPSVLLQATEVIQ